ncbi:MAG: DNA gyrase/topoisomerase IV subunit A [Cyclobacteriaceae bacterium]|nr:DNA gyrase/topoisomerase IV subunit A [Cyclobacteriaceae bacterium]
MSEENENAENPQQEEKLHNATPVTGMYENWFLDYASYVILERAVPSIVDGFKPVQRRIMHAMKEMDDGRFNKVANIIGQTMQYHPHGDASIGDAITNMGQKDILIETQGNWGDIRTGDSAAAPRYIEARLSKFALDVVFNPQTTDWQLSYDGRKKEPVDFPLKFPLLLAQGVEGIAVGLSTKVLPHNFIELIDASIDILKGKKIRLYPDFPTGGKADVSDYNDGLRGGRVKVRAKIEVVDKKSIIVTQIPFGTTTSSLIESIIKANDKGKIKIKQVVDNTAKDVEILITLAPGQSPDLTIDALYAFTDCESSISPNACVIIEDKPRFLTVSEILKTNTDQTVDLLRREQEIRRDEIKEKLLFSSLEKIFIENRIYRDIEECETWEDVISTIDKGLEPFKSQFYRVITQDDIVKLTEIKIKRISKFDSFKADELMRKLQDELAETEYNLEHITEFAIKYYTGLKEKYGKDKGRKTELTNFENIDTTLVVANNQKLYVNRADGFIGWGLKKDEFISDCSDIDDVVVIRRDGKFQVSRIADKVFVGKDIIYVGIWNKNDDRMTYNLVYLDGKSGRSMAKRFQISSVTRDKEYDLTKGDKNSKVLYLTANANGEAEIVTVKLTAASSARKKIFDFDFSDIDIKGRGAGGNILTRYPVRKIEFKEQGTSTLSGLKLWYDSSIGRLNKDERGIFVGKFNGEDTIIAFYKDGSYELTSYELTNKYDPNKLLIIERFNPEKIFTAIHYDGPSKTYFVKRFKIETSTIDKKFTFINEEPGCKLISISSSQSPVIELTVTKGKSKEKILETMNLSEVVDVKGWKAQGNKLTPHKFVNVKELKSEETVDENVEEKTPADGTVTESVNNSPKEKNLQEKSTNTETQFTEKKDKPGNYKPGDTIELDF